MRGRGRIGCRTASLYSSSTRGITSRPKRSIDRQYPTMERMTLAWGRPPKPKSQP